MVEESGNKIKLKQQDFRKKRIKFLEKKNHNKQQGTKQ